MEKIRCLITAGATREYFDPVRFISNPSTGKMGWNIARAARGMGWETTLVLGACALPDIDGVKTLRVVSAEDMLGVCRAEFEKCDILIMSAAVSDVRPKFKADHKTKKDEIDLHPQLERTPDILATLSANKGNRITVGFAAETNDVLGYAKKKLASKNLDAIVANDVSDKSIGFASDNNKITVIKSDLSVIESGFDTKENLARQICRICADIIAQKRK